MESIVNPWIIYFIGVIDGIDNLFDVLAFIGGVAFFCFWIGQLATGGDYWEQWKKYIKHIIIIPLILIFVSLVFPSKNTIIAMYVANEVTYDRAEKVVEVGKDIKNSLKKDILDIIQELTKESEK
jgi:hypothetical protein